VATSYLAETPPYPGQSTKAGRFTLSDLTQFKVCDAAMAVPIDLVGAWRRSGLIWRDRRVVDYCDVVWLQTPEWFVDIRILMAPDAVPSDAKVPPFFYRDRCFAGVTTFDPPRITWEHRIDSNPAPSSGPDSSPLQWRNGVVFECGTSTVDDETHLFIEEWLRMTDDTVKWSAEIDGSSGRIEAGEWAVEITDERPTGFFTATRYDLTDTGWKEIGSIQA
jgi:hypothetical protein